MTTETRSPTSNTGTWHNPNNAHADDLNYAYCGNGETGRTQDYEGYGFSSEGTITSVRVDVKGYSGDGTKHTVKIYVWDGSTWQLIGEIIAEDQCHAHQFDATSHINTPTKLNTIKTRIESTGLSTGGPTDRWVRVCWIPVYANWALGPTETITAKEFPMIYYAKTPQELRSKVNNATITHVAKDFPEALLKTGKAKELRSKWL